jgi:hypothetical protein
MNPIIEGKIYRMYLEIESDHERLAGFLRELRGRHLIGNRISKPRRGFHKIEIREFLFLEIPIKRSEKMIRLGWQPAQNDSFDVSTYK